ncbi:NlpC/P60 family protein [Oscillatoria amoena NRMC-F 0135]|nr:NlpC/P60 family protein [Oscillatoria amoena NRMC-F 0135]
MIATDFDYGVCRLSLVSLRAEPAHAAEQTSQLLFGEQYEVTEISPDKKWMLIRNNYDRFTGWLDARQHHPISREHFEYLNGANFKIITDIATSILYNKSPLQILMGSIIPISGAELFKMEEQFAFNGESKNLGQKRDVEFLKAIAAKYINAPFMPGGRSPFGIDPSGFIQLVFKISGYPLGRTIHQQMDDGRPVKEVDEGKPGDLIFFKSMKDKSLHVGILLADDKVIHVAEKVRVDHFDEGGILNPDARVYTHTFMNARRILLPEQGS